MEARIEARFEGRTAILELTGRNGTNAMDEGFVRDLDRVAATIADAVGEGRSDIVVIRALGRHFCVGGDLSELAGSDDPPATMTHMTGFAHRGIAALHQLEVPVVAAWQGATAGGGIGLLLAADIVIAGESASMTAGYSAVGLSPDAGVSWALSRRVGPARALELLLTNRRLDARAALAMGLASEVVGDNEIDMRVSALVDQILEIGASVSRGTKRLVAEAGSTELEKHLDAEARGIAEAAAGARFTTAASAYLRGSNAG